MNRETMVKCTRRVPFRPFVMHLADGQVLQVRHPEHLTISEDCFAIAPGDGTGHVVSLDQLVSIQYANEGARG